MTLRNPVVLSVFPCALALGLLVHDDVFGACNLIPVAKKTFPSVMGSIVDPLTVAGRSTSLRVNPVCDGSAGFEAAPMLNAVTLRFEPPTGAGATDVPIDPGTIVVSDCSLPGGRCAELSFETPDTTLLLPPNGLAGPARIFVRDAGAAVVAEIAELFLPTTGCDRRAEQVFEKLTVLPPANVFADVVTGTLTEIFATVDGGNNLLVPFDYWGGGVKTVLAETPGSPVAIFLDGQADVPALGALDPNTLPDVLAAKTDPSRFVRSFTLDGRPLPPLLRVTSTGGLFGTADAVESVLRVARIDDDDGTDIHDFTDRLTAGKGVILLSALSAGTNDPVPLTSLRSSSASVGYVREELRETTNLNAGSGDADLDDFVVQVASSDDGTATSTHKAVKRVQAPSGFALPALATSDDVIAFLESEVDQNSTDLNFDGDVEDGIVRIFDRTGGELGLTSTVAASTAPLIDGTNVVASDNTLFVRSPGAIGNRVAGDAVDLEISPDGAHVYALRTAGPSSSAIDIYDRNSSTGDLAFSAAGPLLSGGKASHIALSSDGLSVYALQAFIVTQYSRNPVTGALAFAVSNGVGVTSATAIGINPASGRVYLFDSAYTELPASPTPSFLSYDASLAGLPFATSVTGGAIPTDIYVDTTGTTLFAATDTPGDVRTCGTAITGPSLGGSINCSGSGFPTGIDAALMAPDGVTYLIGSGVINYAGGAFVPSAVDDPRFAEGNRLVVSRNGRYFYVVDTEHVAIFRRTPTIGALVPLEVVDRPTDLAAFVPTAQPAATDDDRHLYVGAGAVVGPMFQQIATLRTDSVLQSIETATGVLRATEPPTNAVATLADRALVLTPETGAGVDLNFDGDNLDDVAQLLDVSTGADVLTSLNVAAIRGDLGANLIAIAVPEANEAGLDRNADGDVKDHVLAVVDASAPGTPTNTSIAVDQIGVSGDAVVVITPEANDGFSDLNGDLDAQDRVIRVYDEPSGVITELGWAADEFVVVGSLVAFRSPEAEFGAGIVLNGDGDTQDSVMFVYDIASDTLINTGRAAIPCELPGCELGTPYKVRGQTVSFLTDEVEQAADLNGDGDSIDIVLTVFNFPSASNQVVDTAVDDATMPSAVEPKLPPFPETILEGTLLLAEAKESEIGLDINEDGVVNDEVVVLVAGDADEDGIFDDFDSCVEQTNATQTDVDADGLGDTACDPSPAACPASPLVSCKAPAASKAQLHIKDKGPADKRALKFKWGKGAMTTLADIGDPLVSDPVYSVCVYDSSGAGDALLRAGVPPGGTCSGKACWREQPGKGFKYKDKAGSAGGVQQLQLRAGDTGKAKLQVKGKGAGLVLPMLPLTGAVTAQLHVDEGVRHECWSATFSTSLKNDPEQYKAKSD